MSDFMHNEFQQVGTDYSSAAEVAVYDARMRQFRDIDSENEKLFAYGECAPGKQVIELGFGTGAFSRRAARGGCEVCAFDISDAMIAYAKQRAAEEHLNCAEFRKGGFLTFDAADAAADVVVSSLALHHLSDVWKAVALGRIRKCLKTGGILVLADVVFDWGGESPEAYFARITEAAPASRKNFARHIADEFSTLSWIMTGLLERAGFAVEKEEFFGDFMHFYKCRAV